MADASERRSWDVGRFARTLDFFDAVPVVSWVRSLVFGSTPPPPAPHIQAGEIFNFQQSNAEIKEIWGALDDVVMGGVSSSSLALTPEGALFAGNVSTDNSGGFVSVRTRNFEPGLNLSDREGILLRVKGDGQRYKFFLRDGEGWDSVAYGISFDTVADQWTDVRLPFADLRPVFRAKTLENATPLNTSSVRSLQIMLSKFEYDRQLNPHFKPGNFHLLVSAIGVY